MDYVNKLPFILACIAALIAGGISYYVDVPKTEIYTRMIISLVTFFLIGQMVKGLLINILEDIEEKKQREKKEKEERELEEKKVKGNQDSNKSHAGTKGKNIDIIADDEFSPLEVSQIIRKNMDE